MDLGSEHLIFLLNDLKQTVRFVITPGHQF
jgi:hypothetical protein